MIRRLRPALAAVLALVALPATAELFAITNATVHTAGPAGVIARATVVVRNGHIEALGTGLPTPAGATVIDARGQPLTPGLIAARSHLGLVEITGVDETNDLASEQKRHSAALEVADALNPRSVLLPVNRIDGLTRALTVPESIRGGSLFAGQGAIISLAGLLAEGGDWILRPRAAMVASLGEAGAALAGSRPAAIASLREAFDEARGGGFRSGGGRAGDAELGALDLAALRSVLNREMPLVLHAERASDIVAALRLAEAYELNLVISGAAEAHLVAAELASRQVPVLIDPSRNLPAKFESLHARADAVRILQQAGVRYAFIDDSEYPSHNPRNLRQLAGIAAGRGLTREQALAAITIRPAEILGLANVLGSIEPGKRADLVLWDGDPLEVTSVPTRVWIDGRAMPMDSRQTRLRDRYRPRPPP
jgi:imidazolonepropionase-like amidohydrolase